MKYKLRTGIILFALTFPFYLYLQRSHPLFGEEFMLFVEGERVINGEVPYRDFFQFITPGSIYIAGLLFKIFGVKLSVMKVFIAFEGSIIVILTYLLSIKIIENKYLSLLPPLLIIFYSIPQAPLFYHHWNAEVFLLLSIILFLNYISGGSKVKLFSSGLCAGVTFLFLQHKGFLIFFVLILFLFFDGLINKKSIKTTLPLVAIGFFIPLILFLIYLYLNGATEKFFYDSFYWIINSYAPFNSLPEYLYFEKITFTHYLEREGLISALLKTRNLLFVGYLPLILIIYGAISIFKNPDRNIFFVYLSSFFLFLSVLPRPDFINIVYVIQPFFVLFVHYLENFLDKNKISKPILYFIITLLIINELYGCITLIRNTSQYKYQLKTQRGVIYFKSIEEMKPYAEVFAVLDELKDKRVFVYNWSTFFYFLSGKKNYISYDAILPAYNTDIQMGEVIEQLKKENIEYVIYDNLDAWLKTNGEKSLYPEGSKKINLNNKLNEYITSNYEVIRKVENFNILKSKVQ
jgi:hypothetical protein